MSKTIQYFAITVIISYQCEFINLQGEKSSRGFPTFLSKNPHLIWQHFMTAQLKYVTVIYLALPHSAQTDHRENLSALHGISQLDTLYMV